MSNNETRVSNERLEGMLAGLEGESKLTHQSVLRSTIRAMILELQALRSTPVEAEPVAWQHRVYFDDSEDWSEWRDGKAPGLYSNRCEERPLFAHPLPNPSPSDGEVSDACLIRVADAIAQAFHAEHGEWLSQYTRIELAKASLQSSKGGQP